MLQRIKDRIKRKRMDRLRRLFSFYDGQRTRREDPMRIHRDLLLHETFTWDLGFLVDSGDPEATKVMCNAVCDVFGVYAWDSATETGLTDTELIAILYNYSTYVEDIKKKYSLGPTLQQPTESKSSTSEVSPSEDTNCCSDVC